MKYITLILVLYLPAVAFSQNAKSVHFEDTLSRQELQTIPARLNYYQEKKQWKCFSVLVNELIRDYPPKSGGTDFGAKSGLGGIFPNDDWALNSAAWNVFLACFDRKVLESALSWSNASIQIAKSPQIAVQYYDTKANLLYKLKKVQAAIACEKYALGIARDIGATDFINDYSKSISKMEKEEPTWPINN